MTVEAGGVEVERKVAVLGSGSWGTALATVLAHNGYNVSLWSRNREKVREMAETRRNQQYLPDVELEEAISPTAQMEHALQGAEAVLFAVPSHAMRKVATQAACAIPTHQLVVHAAKGFEPETLKRMSQVLSETLSTHSEGQIVALSGPSHAEEVVRRQPTTVVVSSMDARLGGKAQDMLINSYFRVYTNPDLIGVEIGGALKNIIALGAGMSDGLGFGDNAKAALLTRGLAEIGRLGVAMGAKPTTFAGLAGVGDLVVTCTSQHSRNWRAGYLLGQGYPLENVLDEMGMVVEGVKTTKAAYDLSKRYGVDMPIARELYRVLFNGKQPQQAVEDLMGRGKTHEMEDVVRHL